MGIESKRSLGDDAKEQMREFEDLMSNYLPDEIESGLNEVVADSFEAEKYQGKSGSKKWESRKRDSAKEASKTRDNRKALLVGSGDLIKSYETEVRAGGSEIALGSDLIYAEVHNEGKQAGRGKGFTMPQRQHAPIPGEPIPKLNEKIDKWMDNEMDKIFD